MMTSVIIPLILMTLTGGVLVNQNPTFQHAEKETETALIKKANETYTFTAYPIETASYTVNTTTYPRYENKKYVLSETFNDENPDTNFSTVGMTIQNSIYTTRKLTTTTGEALTYITFIYAISPYLNINSTSMTFNFEYSLTHIGGTNYLTERYGETTQDISNLINLTNYQYTDIVINENDFINPITNVIEVTDNDNNISKSLTLQIDNDHSTRYVVYQAVISNTNATYTDFEIIPTNQTFRITPNEYLQYEVVDIGSLIFTILTLPFSFITQGFNLTVFNGTPYALNIGNIILTIIAIITLLWLIKKIMGK